MPRPAATEVSYTATTEMRAAATAHRAAEMCTTTAAAHSATADVRCSAAMPAAASSSGSRIGRARERDR
jgi:hypothetical protein